MSAIRVPVLMYHRIGSAHNKWEKKLCVSQKYFESHMHALSEVGYSACSMENFIRWLNKDIELPDKTLLITFDDGFLGVHDYALPVLRELGWPATVFLVTSLIGEQDIWCRDENPSGKTYPLVGLREIEKLKASGFSIFSHSRNHADLGVLDDDDLENELLGSRHDLENILDEPVEYFAYPYGRYNERVIVKLKEAGYKAAFSVQPGFNRQNIDPYRIRRIDVFGTDTSSNLLRKISYGVNDGSWRQVIRYYFNRLLAKRA